MPAFRMLTFYITMSTIIVHVDFLLIFMGFPRFCPHYLCYVDKSWTNCHLWTNLSFFLFLTIPYFIRVCEVIYHNSFCTFCHFHKDKGHFFLLLGLHLQLFCSFRLLFPLGVHQLDWWLYLQGLHLLLLLFLFFE